MSGTCERRATPPGGMPRPGVGRDLGLPGDDPGNRVEVQVLSSAPLCGARRPQRRARQPFKHERESPTSAGRRRIRAGLLLTFSHLPQCALSDERGSPSSTNANRRPPPRQKAYSMPMSGETLSRSPAELSGISRFRSSSRRPKRLSFTPAAALSSLNDPERERDVGEHRGAVEGVEILGLQARRIDDVAADDVHGRRDARMDCDHRAGRVRADVREVGGDSAAGVAAQDARAVPLVARVQVGRHDAVVRRTTRGTAGRPARRSRGGSSRHRSAAAGQGRGPCPVGWTSPPSASGGRRDRLDRRRGRRR